MILADFEILNLLIHFELINILKSIPDKGNCFGMIRNAKIFALRAVHLIGIHNKLKITNFGHRT